MIEAADPVVLEAIDHVGHVPQQHRRAVAVGDDDGAVGLGHGDLIVGGDRVGLVRAVERALGARDIRGDDDVAHVLEPDAVIGEARKVRLDADRRPDIALHRDAADAGQFASRCASRVSAMSLSWRCEIVSEVIASVTIGASAGFTLE